jgi:two-component system response regulator PilR (NtrC family)
MVNIPRRQPPNGTLARQLYDAERTAIHGALLECRYNRASAARKLGMSYRSFRYSLAKFGLP